MRIDRTTAHTGATRPFPQSSASAVASGSDPKEAPVPDRAAVGLFADQLGERTELVEDLVDRLSQAADGDADEVELILWNSGDSCTVRP